MDLDLTALDAAQLEELQANVNEQVNLRYMAEQKTAVTKFLKTKEAKKLAQKMADVQAEFASLPMTSKFNINVELTIKLKPHTTPKNLFRDGYGVRDMCDLFSPSYSFKLVNAEDFSKQANKQLCTSIRQVLEDACGDVVEFDKTLFGTLDNFIKQLNPLSSKIDNLSIDFEDIIEELENLNKEEK